MIHGVSSWRSFDILPGRTTRCYFVSWANRSASRRPPLSETPVYALLTTLVLAADPAPAELPPIIRSAASGPWSAAATWNGGKVPATGDRVLIRGGHRVVYDVHSEHVFRGINIVGQLTFAPHKDTRLEVGLIK